MCSIKNALQMFRLSQKFSEGKIGKIHNEGFNGEGTCSDLVSCFCVKALQQAGHKCAHVNHSKPLTLTKFSAHTDYLEETNQLWQTLLHFLM